MADRPLSVTAQIAPEGDREPGEAHHLEGQGGRDFAGNRVLHAQEIAACHDARATLAAIRAARGATAEARALAERVASEGDLLHHAAYGLGPRMPNSAILLLRYGGSRRRRRLASPVTLGTNATRCSSYSG